MKVEREMVNVDTTIPTNPRLRIEYPNGAIVDLFPYNLWVMGPWRDGHQPYAVLEDGEWVVNRLVRTEVIPDLWTLPGGRVAHTETVRKMVEPLGCKVRVLDDGIEERGDGYMRRVNAARVAAGLKNHMRNPRAHSKAHIVLDEYGQTMDEGGPGRRTRDEFHYAERQERAALEAFGREHRPQLNGSRRGAINIPEGSMRGTH